MIHHTDLDAVADGETELVQQIAMRSMNFHDAKPRIAGATAASRKCASPPPDPILRERFRDRVSLRERQGLGADYRRQPPSASGYQPTPIPWSERAGFAPCMCELDASHAALFMDKSGDAPKRHNVVVAPDPEILRANATFRQDRRRFRKDQARTADCAATEVHEVPVVGKAVLTGVLAHRRDGDSILERDVAKSERVKKMWHRPQPHLRF